MNASIITVTDFKAFAPEVTTSNYDNPTISGMIASASDIVSDILGYNPILETITDEVKEARIDTAGDLLVFPSKVPVVSVAALNIMKGTITLPVSLYNGQGAAKYNIDYSRRHIRYPYGELTLTGTPLIYDIYRLRYAQFYIKFTYTAGWDYSQLPGAIKQATISVARDLFSNQYNQMGASRITQGSLTIEYKASDPTGRQRSKFMADAYRLLAPYRKMV